MSKKKSVKALEEIEAQHQEFLGVGKENDQLVSKVLQILEGQCSYNVLGALFDRFRCPTLDLEWTVNKFWGNFCRLYMIESLEKVYSGLVEKKAIEKKSISFNDADDSMWYIPDPETSNRRIVCHEGQTLRFLFVWDEPDKMKRYGKLHIRRYYDKYVPSSKIKDWEKQYKEKDEQKYKDKGILWSIRQTDSLSEYSDEEMKNPYPSRLSLNHYKKNGFQVRYGDFRDKGYVLTYQAFDNNVEGAMSQHQLIKLIAECIIPCMVMELFEEEFKDLRSKSEKF